MRGRNVCRRRCGPPRRTQSSSNANCTLRKKGRCDGRHPDGRRRDPGADSAGARGVRPRRQPHLRRGAERIRTRSPWFGGPVSDKARSGEEPYSPDYIQDAPERSAMISPKSCTLIVAFVALATLAHAQQYPKQAQLPNPYLLVENWPTVPQNLNGGRWGELIRADIDRKGNIWVFHRCFNTE